MEVPSHRGAGLPDRTHPRPVRYISTMPTIRIGVASTPLTATLDEGLPVVLDAITAAAEADVCILCLPETVLPGHRMQERPVPEIDPAALDRAVNVVAAAAAAADVVTVLSVERPTPAGREIVALVIGADGTVLGEQAKTQIDPAEDAYYVAGTGRRIFTAAGLTFGVATCHEAFRYPELSRLAARSGARVVFVPHYVTTDGGPVLEEWCAPGNPYNEKALMMRAIENTIYVAAANIAGTAQGSASAVIGPDGSLLAQVPYGEVGIAWADVDPAAATGLIARRWAPERNLPV